MIYPSYKKEDIPPELQPLLETIKGRIKILVEEIEKSPDKRKYSPTHLQSMSEAIAREISSFDKKVEEIRKNCMHIWQKVALGPHQSDADLRPSQTSMRCFRCNCPRSVAEVHVKH